VFQLRNANTNVLFVYKSYSKLQVVLVGFARSMSDDPEGGGGRSLPLFTEF
jgi:hypothetical protein